MGYREYAKDYEIEYVPQEGKRRPKAVRIYVGPYFRFRASAEVIRRRKWQYLLLQLLEGVSLLIPMLVDCSLTRTWYAQVPAAAAWIPWLLAACALWRLWTAGEKVEREHYDLLHDRMRGASFFLMGFAGLSTLGTVIFLTQEAPQMADICICICFLTALACGAAMFALCKDLEMLRMENPEKPQAGKNRQRP